MHYLFTKTDEPLSPENLHYAKEDISSDAFHRRSPINEKKGIVVMASANRLEDLNEKKKILLKNMERSGKTS